jgi:hypothetical protein
VNKMHIAVIAGTSPDIASTSGHLNYICGANLQQPCSTVEEAVTRIRRFERADAGFVLIKEGPAFPARADLFSFTSVLLCCSFLPTRPGDNTQFSSYVTIF